jgi:hypothetical protein
MSDIARDLAARSVRARFEDHHDSCPGCGHVHGYGNDARCGVCHHIRTEFGTDVEVGFFEREQNAARARELHAQRDDGARRIAEYAAILNGPRIIDARFGRAVLASNEREENKTALFFRAIPLLHRTGYTFQLAACQKLCTETLMAEAEFDPAKRVDILRALANPMRGLGKVVSKWDSAFSHIRQSIEKHSVLPVCERNPRNHQMARFMGTWLPMFKRRVREFMSTQLGNALVMMYDHMSPMRLHMPGSPTWIEQEGERINPFFADLRENVTVGHDCYRRALDMRDLCLPFKDGLEFSQLISNHAFAFDTLMYFGYQYPMRVWRERGRLNNEVIQTKSVHVDFLSYISMIARASVRDGPTARITTLTTVLLAEQEQQWVTDAVKIYLRDYNNYLRRYKNVFKKNVVYEPITGDQGVEDGDGVGTVYPDGSYKYHNTLLSRKCSPLHWMIRNGHKDALFYLLGNYRHDDDPPFHLVYQLIHVEYAFTYMTTPITAMTFARCFYHLGDGNGRYRNPPEGASERILERYRAPCNNKLFEAAVEMMWRIYEKGGVDSRISRGAYRRQREAFGTTPYYQTNIISPIRGAFEREGVEGLWRIHSFYGKMHEDIVAHTRNLERRHASFHERWNSDADPDDQIDVYADMDMTSRAVC